MFTRPTMQCISIHKALSSAIVLSLGCMLSFSGCKKENLFEETPSISLTSVLPGTITEFEDSLVFIISYKDGNGDLGENDPNVKNLFIHDPRINADYGFRIQQLAPDNAEIAIQGDLTVTLTGIGITDGSNQQSVIFEVWVVDRAGNQSNKVSSPQITLNK